ncbi:MAG TPA: formate/nitrite transporter family protein [Actinomycetota bacterium]|nr:formate/nitrite transporter family protein [Actinomycetota bacterium]
MPSGDLHPMTGQDALSPSEVAFLVETRGVAKATAPIVTTFVLGVVAGAFIALGGVLAITIGTGSELGFGPTRWLAGVGFSLGLILVVVAGAELFTGNNLIVMSTVTGKVGVRRLLANWGVVYLGNAIGALSVVGIVYVGEWWRGDDLGIGVTALSTAVVKTSLPFFVVLSRGILANALVCLAVWLAAAGRSVIDKVAAIVFPISAFVAAGFEHSVANMFFIPMGLVLLGHADVVEAAHLPSAELSTLDGAGLMNNLVAVTIGNVIGGALLVGLVYWFVYVRPTRGA